MQHWLILDGRFKDCSVLLWKIFLKGALNFNKACGSISKRICFNPLTIVHIAHLKGSFQQRLALWSTSKLFYTPKLLIEQKDLFFHYGWVMSYLFWGMYLGCEGHLLAPHFETRLFYGWTVSAGMRFPVVSSCIHLHEHAETGHSVWSLDEKKNWEL